MQVSDNQNSYFSTDIPIGMLGIKEQGKRSEGPEHISSGKPGPSRVQNEQTSLSSIETGTEINSTTTQIVLDPSSGELKPREWYVQQFEEIRNQFLSDFEQTKERFKEKADILKVLEYIKAIVDIKIKIYRNKILTIDLIGVPEKLRKFKTSELGKPWGYLKDEVKLRSVKMGETFYNPPRSTEIYDKMREAFQEYCQAKSARNEEGCKQAWNKYLQAYQEFWGTLRDAKLVKGEFSPEVVPFSVFETYFRENDVKFASFAERELMHNIS